MRPRELTVEGFRSHRHRATFDFRDRRLIGVVGPIGAGKSSLLDAIVFALYGKTPTFERDTRSLIHQLADVAKVQLEFEVDHQRWRVTRAIKRKGQSQHKLERLDDDGTSQPDPVTGEKATRERIETLLGLDFAGFCRSVMLAQGRFAEFLSATPKERTDVLKGVFGYERFDAALVAARERAAQAEGELGVLTEEGDRLLAAKAELEEATATRDQAMHRHRELTDAAQRIAGLDAEVAAARLREQGAVARSDAIGSLTRSLPSRDDVAEVVALAEDAARIAREADEALVVATQALADSEISRAAVAERVGDHGTVADLADVVARMEREAADAEAAQIAAEEARAEREDAEATLGVRRAEHAAAADEEAACTATAAAAATTRAEAEAALHAARHAEMAADLRRGLHADEPCPVCDQKVTMLPPPAEAPAVDAATAALEAARHAEQEAGSAFGAASSALAAAVTRLEAAEQEHPRRATAADRAEAGRQAAEAALQATQSELVDRLGEGDPRALLETRRRELEEAERAVEEARAGERAARTHAEQVRTTQRAVAERLATIRDAVLAAWARVEEGTTVPTEPDGIRASFTAVVERLTDELERSRTDAAEATAAVAALAEQVAGVLSGAGLEPRDDVARACGEAEGVATAARQRVSGLEEVLARGSDLEVRLGEAIARRDLAKRLAADLQPSRFLGFVLEEERRALAELGSHHLEELTEGAYRFTDDDAFDVVDVNAASTHRTADSLSGGETFLASLALALALAEMVARGGGRLDSFFLDEGFGSLDPEHLDRAMDGIARLVAGDGDRLVVLVSHVEQMRQTLEDLIVLDKDPRTGDTIVVSGTSAAIHT